MVTKQVLEGIADVQLARGLHPYDGKLMTALLEKLVRLASSLRCEGCLAPPGREVSQRRYGSGRKLGSRAKPAVDALRFLGGFLARSGEHAQRERHFALAAFCQLGADLEGLGRNDRRRGLLDGALLRGVNREVNLPPPDVGPTVRRVIAAVLVVHRLSIARPPDMPCGLLVRRLVRDLGIWEWHFAQDLVVRAPDRHGRPRVFWETELGPSACPPLHGRNDHAHGCHALCVVQDDVENADEIVGDTLLKLGVNALLSSSDADVVPGGSQLLAKFEQLGPTARRFLKVE
jgi:hypothetical protein